MHLFNSFIFFAVENLTKWNLKKNIDLFGCTSSQLWPVGSSSLTRDQAQASCSGSMESWPLDHQRSPKWNILDPSISQKIYKLNYKCSCVCDTSSDTPHMYSLKASYLLSNYYVTGTVSG